MTNILLLGGTGFLGKSLLKQLNKKNSLKLMIHKSDFQTNAEKFNGNILKKKSFFNEIRKNEIIINFLGQITINVYGENLEQPSKENDPLKPKTTYGVVKMITEQMYEYFSKMYGIDIVILRLADIYGPDKKNGFLTQILNSLNDKTIVPVCYNDGKQQRDMLYIDDAIGCILNVINNPNQGFHSFNVSSGKRYSINELISKIEKIAKSKLAVNYSSEIPDEKCIWADNEKAKKFLKFEPKIDIEIGLKSIIDHFNSKK